MTTFNSNSDHSDQGEGINRKDNTFVLNDGETVTAYRGINLGSESLTYANESRIHLPSLEDEMGQPFSTFPSPHLSAPVLPPIKKNNEYEQDNNALANEGFATLKRPRPTASLNRTGKLPSQTPTSTDLQAIR